MTPTILKIHRSCDGRLTITAPLEFKTLKALVDALVKEPAS
jgi:hypothetical protein|tara:strand:+ start:120 stop:242 length:123 start_codon:yes stop_codon:yes gene_type:complete